MPDTIEDAVIARIAPTLARGAGRPPAPARSSAAASFPTSWPGSWTSPPDALEAPLQELVDQFVLDAPGLRGLYDFRHQLLRDALYRHDPGLGPSPIPRPCRGVRGAAGGRSRRSTPPSITNVRVCVGRPSRRPSPAPARRPDCPPGARPSSCTAAPSTTCRTTSPPAERAAIMVRVRRCRPGDIEEHDVCIRMAHEAAAIYRAIGMPVKAIGALGNEFAVWRREARPLERPRGDGSRDAGPSWKRCPIRRRCSRLAPRSRFFLSLIALDARDLAEVRRQTAKLRAFADELGDPECGCIAEWKDGLADAIDGDVQARSGTRRRGCLRGGRGKAGKGAGVTAFREASTVAAAALDYDAAEHWIGEGVRYADSIEQSHCAHVMRSTQAMVSWAGADLVEAAATRAPGDRRQGLPPRRRRWRAGRSATWPWRAASSTRRPPSSTDALGVRTSRARRSS